MLIARSHPIDPSWGTISARSTLHTQGMELRLYWQIIRRRLWLVLGLLASLGSVI